MGTGDADAVHASDAAAPRQQAGIARLFLSGATAACIAEATTLPLDTAKVQLLVQLRRGVPRHSAD